MKPGDLVLISAAGTSAARAQNGKIGLVTNLWHAPDYLGGDTYLDVLVDGINMSFMSDEVLEVDDETR